MDIPVNINFIYAVNSGKFTYVDKALAGLLKTEADQLSAEVISSYIYPDELPYLKNSLNSLLNGSFTGSIQFRLKADDSERWFRLTPFFIKQKSLILGHIADITADINNLYNTHKYGNKKNSILNILAHDLRGPLGIAKAITQSVKREMTDEYLVNQTETLAAIIKQCVDLIADLTEREFLETVEVELVKKRIDIARKIRDYLEEFRRSEKTTKRTFNFSSSSKSIYLKLDEAKFMQIVNNLMSNALKFTHNFGTISINITEQANAVLFTFADDGIGIPQQFHAQLFDKFTDARRKGLHGEPTVGVGLSVVKTLIEWHRGKIWFESRENQGTTFYIEIPKTDI